MLLPAACGFDNGTITRLYEKGSISTRHPDAGITKGDHNPTLKTEEFWAVSLGLFPGDRSRSVLPLTALSVKRPIHEKEGTFIELVAQTMQDVEYTVWVDATRGCIPVRIHSSFRGLPRIDLKIAYRADASTVWVPDAWVLTRFQDDGSLSESLDCRVTASAVNPAISDKEFAVTLPPGTLVLDSADGTRRPGVVNQQGNLKHYTEAEMSKPYPEIMAMVEADDHRGVSSKMYLKILVGLVVLVLVLFVSLRVYKRRQVRSE